MNTPISATSNISSPATHSSVAAPGAAARNPQTPATAPAVAPTVTIALPALTATVMTILREGCTGWTRLARLSVSRSLTGASSTRKIAASIGHTCIAISMTVRGSWEIGKPYTRAVFVESIQPVAPVYAASARTAAAVHKPARPRPAPVEATAVNSTELQISRRSESIKIPSQDKNAERDGQSQGRSKGQRRCSAEAQQVRRRRNVAE